jgi:glutathione S-transferase
MKLFYAPGACSLADHIALIEAGLRFEYERVDLKAKTTASGANFLFINPKGYVPALVLDSGEVITENPAVLDWIALQSPSLSPGGPLGRTHLLEALSHISAELHKSFHPFFSGDGEPEKAKARTALTRKFQLIADQLRGEYVFGDRLTVADCYLFVMLLWAGKFRIALPAPLSTLRARMLALSSVQEAMKAEGWAYSAPPDTALPPIRAESA